MVLSKCRLLGVGCWVLSVGGVLGGARSEADSLCCRIDLNLGRINLEVLYDTGRERA